MNKNLFKRFEVVLQIIRQSLDEPLDFQSLSLTFGSGSRQLSGLVDPADSQARTFRYKLPGKSGTADAAAISGLIREMCQLYDSCRLELMTRGQLRFFAADDRGVRMGNLDPAESLAEMDKPEGTSGTRDYLVKINEAQALLQAIGIIDQQGRLRNDKIRKYNQVDRFIELADPLLREVADKSASMRVVDLACGKSYLSFVLNYYIREKLNQPCQFLGIDWSVGVIGSSRQLADRLGYRNMTFEQADLKNFRVPGPVDLAISLHACDTATDLALAAAIKARSRAIIVVPCCQRELLADGYDLPEPLAGLLEHGVLKARMADLLTDHLRLLLLKAAGYETSLIEYISPLDTPKNLMIRARLTGRRDGKAEREYRQLTAMLGHTITLGKIMEENDYGHHSGDGEPG